MSLTKVWVVTFWKMDEPFRFNEDFNDGAKASDFVILKQSQGYLVRVSSEDRKQSTSMKSLFKKALRSVGKGFMNAGGGK